MPLLRNLLAGRGLRPLAKDDELTLSEDDEAIKFDPRSNDDSNHPLFPYQKAITSVDPGAYLGVVEIIDNGHSLRFENGTAYDYLAAGETETVEISYKLRNAWGSWDEATIELTIEGKNDPAKISGELSGRVVENRNLSDEGALIVSDADHGQSVFQVPASLEGQFGTFDFDAETGSWNYTLDSTNPDVSALAPGEELVDTLELISADSTASETLMITVAADPYAGEIGPGGGSANGALAPQESAAGIPVDPGESDYWLFYAEAGDTVTVQVNRIDGDFDPAMLVYGGVYLDPVDEFGTVFSGHPDQIDLADDEIPPAVPGPFEDPQTIFVAPYSGYYTAVVYDSLSGPDTGGDGAFDYQFEVVIA